ncbi:MAG: hypothetical protein BroJett021_40850 [Chloroflexota bacterium]|nr:MAG: hypothetical protein BroJett021_40850 [Chloroflexota bacterium]
MFAPGNRWRDSGILVLLIAALVILIWWLNEPITDVLDAAEDVRGWIISFGPLAPLAYVTFFAAQILIAPLPGSFLSVLGGYLFGFGAGLLLSLLGLSIGATLAILIGRKLGRPILERFFDHAELIRWERKLRLRSPLLWFVVFLFPLPDLAIYIAGLGTTPIRQLIPAVLLGRSIGILIGSTLGTATAHLPAWFVLGQWALFLALAGLVYRYQRPLRYHLLVNLRRSRRMTRGFFKTPLSSPAE